MALYFIQTGFFHKNEYAQVSLKCFFDVLSEQYISILFIRLINLVAEYSDEDVSSNFDDIMLGVSITLCLLKYQLNAVDIDLLNKVLLDWLSEGSPKHKILAACILKNIANVFSEGYISILVKMLLKNLESEDQEVFIFSTIRLMHVRGEQLNSHFARRCLDIFTQKYNGINPQYSLRVILDNFRELFLKQTQMIILIT